nr:beta-1,3-glucan-binding protein [Arma chinensis]
MRVSSVSWSFFIVLCIVITPGINGHDASDNEGVSFSQPRVKRADCGQSHTKVDDRAPCQGERIFHESFDGDSLNSRTWSHEIMMPSDPNYEFVVLDNNPQTSSVSDGRLKIKPSPFEDQYIRSGRIDLYRCTGRLFTDECVKTARGFSILPPIQSARITTKNSFAFKYGKINVRAKLPLGDWILPEIWLEPKRKIYGPSFSSGRIRIASALGNQDLKTKDDDQIGVKVLQSGIIMGTPEKTRARNLFRTSDDGWHSDFHNFTLIWEPDKLYFTIDGGRKESLIEPEDARRLSDILDFDENEANNWQYGLRLAPFDQEFYITLGLSVGGMKDFPDDCLSNGHPKPWKNNAVKAMVNFWKDKDHWFPTWSDKSAFLIDEVSVYAL